MRLLMFVLWGVVAVLWLVDGKNDVAALAFGVGTLWLKGAD